jgi:hypothetical protein
VGETAVVALASDAAGNLALTGSTTGSVDFGGGMIMQPQGGTSSFLAKLDVSLAHRWSKAFTVVGSFTPTSVAADRSGIGMIAIGGGLDGSIQYFPKTVMSSSSATIEVTAATFQP